MTTPTAPIVAYRSRGGRVLRCLLHAPEPSAVSSGDFIPLSSDDLPDGGICTYPAPECARDVLAVADSAQAPAPDGPSTPAVRPQDATGGASESPAASGDAPGAPAPAQASEAHAEGEHAFCGPECEPPAPGDGLREHLKAAFAQIPVKYPADTPIQPLSDAELDVFANAALAVRDRHLEQLTAALDTPEATP